MTQIGAASMNGSNTFSNSMWGSLRMDIYIDIRRNTGCGQAVTLEGLPQGPYERFRGAGYIPSSFPKFAWRKHIDRGTRGAASRPGALRHACHPRLVSGHP